MRIEYDATLETLERLRAESLAAGGDKKIDAQHGKGKLSARERIDLLLDDGTFEEFDMLKTGRGGALGDERTYSGDGVITGHGTIDGREVLLGRRLRSECLHTSPEGQPPEAVERLFNHRGHRAHREMLFI